MISLRIGLMATRGRKPKHPGLDLLGGAQFRQEILRRCPTVTLEHDRYCALLPRCACVGKASNRHVYGCAATGCDCDAIFHGIRLKTKGELATQWRLAEENQSTQA